ncbi:methyl-accepting chemotaxis protein [Roseomonas sp. E05]|uniref:methyl-accepting chemotaxis protein n=1 Tax=Roseomonas sp. E05 TaxID=3046310 RepID=UPI0024B8D35D|nr:methyl-accepting chemotaxis protein [Roseomonas sp. E05]MDJ0389948.1 methyl-accepting chemotaxis protein [Roseomonas sp. E05]
MILLGLGGVPGSRGGGPEALGVDAPWAFSELSAARNVSRQAQQTEGAVLELKRLAECIGEGVQIINDIASQANLLALSAAVEAAQARRGQDAARRGEPLPGRPAQRMTSSFGALQDASIIRADIRDATQYRRPAMPLNIAPQPMTPRTLLRGLMDLPWGAALFGPLRLNRPR